MLQSVKDSIKLFESGHKKLEHLVNLIHVELDKASFDIESLISYLAEVVKQGQLRPEKYQALKDAINSIQISREAPPPEKTYSSAPKIDVEIGSILRDRFKIVDFIGSGAMGDVYKAHDLRRIDAGDEDPEVAIKVLSREFREHPDSLFALQREARKTQSLTHPHIVNVFDFDRDDNHVFMTMELLKGQTLDKYIRERVLGVPRKEAIQFIKEIAIALLHAHKRSLIHSDLKPGNIFVANGEIKIFDFGIARAAAEGKKDQLDAATFGAYTPSYASYEMLTGELDAAPQDDIYALGCIAYEILTSSHPFVRDKRKLSAKEALEFQSTPEKIDKLPQHQWLAIKRCLEFKRDKRYRSVEAFLDDFLPRRQIISPKKISLVTLTACLVLATTFGIFSFYKTKKVEDLINRIAINDDHSITTEIKQLYSQSDEILTNERVSIALRNHLIRSANQTAAKDNYQQAYANLDLGLTLYPNAFDLNAAKQSLSQKAINRIEALVLEVRELTADADFFAKHYAQLDSVFSKIRSIDPNHSILSEPATKAMFNQLIELTIQQLEFAHAQSLIEFTQALYSDEAANPDTIAQINSLQALLTDTVNLQNDAQYQAAIKTKLMPLLSDEVQLSDYSKNLPALKAWINANATNEFSSKLINKLSSLLKSEIQTILPSKNWEKARSTVQPFTQLAASTGEELLTQIDNEQRDHLERVATLENSIGENIQNNALKQATTQLTELVLLAPTSSSAIDLKEQLASAWLDRSQLLKQKNAYTEARESINLALTINPSKQTSDELKRTLLDLEIEEQAYLRQNQLAAQQALAQQNKALIQTIIDQVNGLLATETASTSDLYIISEKLGELTQLSPEHSFHNEVKKQISEKYVTQINRLRGTQPLVALELADAAFAINPEQKEFASIRSELRSAIVQQQKQLNAIKAHGIRQDIESILNSSLTIGAYTILDRKLNELAMLSNNSQSVEQLKQFAALGYKDLLDQLIAANQLDDARKAMDIVQQLDALQDLSQQKSALQQAQ